MLEVDSETCLSTTFCARFLNKNILHVVFYKLTKPIVWLPLLLKIVNNTSIVIIYCPVCDVIDFEIDQIFLIELFFYLTKKLGQNYKDLKKKRSFSQEIKNIFHHYQRAFTEVNKNNFFRKWDSDFNSLKFVNNFF